MHLLLTGATGYLGGFIAAEARAAGDRLTALGRRDPGVGDWLAYDLAAPPPPLPPADALVHAAFDHVPGRYRGGEGEDPVGFLARNRDGSLQLFEAARAAGVRRMVLLSTRAVYGPRAPGTSLTEAMAPAPDTLYGQMKAELEAALADLAAPGLCPVSLRITGVYGQAHPGAWHKWVDLFAEAAAGATPAPRRGTEVHGADMAAAVRLALSAPAEAVAGGAFNVSDLDLDRRDLIAALGRAWGRPLALPAAAPPPQPNPMNCARLQALGWAPGGWPRLEAFLHALPVP